MSERSDKRPYFELAERLASAKEQIVPGSRWEHYKGGQYIVSDIILYEATNEPGVVYRPAAHPQITFVRPLVTWQDMVERADGVKVFRFRLLG